MNAHRTRRASSLLEAIQSADVAYIGTASAVNDRPASSAETGRRGGGWHVAASVQPEHTVFGDLPKGPVSVEGDATRPPERRLALDGPIFPPDTLREMPYWEYARADAKQAVLVIDTQPVYIRAISGQDDTLVAAVRLVRHWVELPRNSQAKAILTDLGKPGGAAVAHAAGFELLLQQNDDLDALIDSFFAITGRPGAATQQALGLLQPTALARPARERVALGTRLLAFWKGENDPAALLGYIAWFSAMHAAWGGDATLKEAVAAEARRAAALTIDGPDAAAWQKRVRQQAEMLLNQI